MRAEGRPVQPPAGGVIQDGTYDLTELLITDASCVDRKYNTPTGLRLAFRFNTTETSSNHRSGQLEAAYGTAAGALACSTGTFGTFGVTLESRGVRGEGVKAYTATADGFMLYDPEGGTCDPKILVFRRRP